jgi:phage terminase large subunit
MNQQLITPVFQKLEAAYNSRLYNVYVLEGGSRSSKTYSIIQFFIKFAYLNNGKNKRVIVCRLKATWVTATVLNDFLEILKNLGIYDRKCHNKSTGAGIYNLWGTEFWFMGLDDEQRIHGLKSDAFWINEAIEANFDDYTNLMQRCSGFGILDYNPSYDEHWIYDKICKRPETRFIHSTMLDNPLIPENSKKQILSYEPTPENIRNGTSDKRKWEIYGLGKRASLEGLIFPVYELVKEIPDWVKRRGYGMDFGYTNDVTAIDDCGFGNNSLYIDEVCHQTYMLSSDIIKFFKEKPKQKVMAESADPRLVDEIKIANIPIFSVPKPAGSVKAGLLVMQGYNIHITERSINAIREIKNYTWIFNEKTQKFENEPIDKFNHHMDATRYWVMGEIMGKAVQKPLDYDRLAAMAW